MKKRILFVRIIWILTVAFVFINTIAFFHAYKFTHYAVEKADKTKSPEQLTTVGKIEAILFGVGNPKPVNESFPVQEYETITLQTEEKIEGWYVRAADARGTVILFHGYSAEKSSMLDKADEFNKLGFNTLIIDFRGCGGSDGNITTIGFNEARDVKAAFDYISGKGETEIFLMGTSMGAVAILKAIADYDPALSGIIIECPFGSMYQTVCSRFNLMNFPSFPMAGLLVFWGGIQNNFWAFGHQPVEYAKSVTCPVLLLYGEQDKNVSRKEIDEIFLNLNGKKTLKTYKLAGHEDYLLKYREEWVEDVRAFSATCARKGCNGALNQ